MATRSGESLGVSRANGSLDDVVAFVEVVAQGGFGAAAQRLGLSRSALYRRLARYGITP